MDKSKYQRDRAIVWQTLEVHRVQCQDNDIAADAYCEAIAAWAAYVTQEMARGKDGAMLITMQHFMFALNKAMEKHLAKLDDTDAPKPDAKELRLAQAQADLLKKAGALN